MKKFIKQFAKKGAAAVGVEFKRRRVQNHDRFRMVSLKPEGKARGNVLLSFIIEPFLRKKGEPISNAHSHDWESVQMAQTFLDMGYCVDVISYLNDRFIPARKYEIFVAARVNFEHIASLLNDDCLKIVHLDAAHWIHNNAAVYDRLLDVKRRRNVVLNSARILEQRWAIENAHCATVLGNQFTIDTYAHSKKKMYRVPVSVPAVYEWPSDKDFNACRRNFIWFGSSGFVHKGLDLVLEAFAQTPELNLTVCGPIEDDQKFKAAYFKELYETPNIRTHGWIDVEGEEFARISRECVGLVYPSCSEGGGSSALTCMHAGIIPIVSYESSVDVDEECGVILKDFQIDTIKREVLRISRMPPAQCREMALKAWQFARRNHTRDVFAAAYRNVMKEIMRVHMAPNEQEMMTPGNDGLDRYTTK